MGFMILISRIQISYPMEVSQILLSPAITFKGTPWVENFQFYFFEKIIYMKQYRLQKAIILHINY